MSYKDKLLEEIQNDLIENGDLTHKQINKIMDMLEEEDINETLVEWAVLHEVITPGVVPRAHNKSAPSITAGLSSLLKWILTGKQEYYNTWKTVASNVYGGFKKLPGISQIRNLYGRLGTRGKAAVIGGLLAAGAYAIYKRIVSRTINCAKACKNAADPRKCMDKCALQYYEGLIATYSKVKSDLRKAGKLTSRKEAAIDKKILSVKRKISKLKAK